jgi:hypothetical protein
MDEDSGAVKVEADFDCRTRDEAFGLVWGESVLEMTDEPPPLPP